MKKTIILSLASIALILSSTKLCAQESPFSFGVKAGVNLSNMSGKVDDDEKKKSVIGFQIGVTAEYALTKNLYLLSGLELTTKGSKVEYKDEEYTDTYKANPMYLQIPIHIGYKIAVSESTKIVFNAGSYLAYGIAGKTKYESKESPEDNEKENFFGKKEDGRAKRFDAGIGFAAGVEFGKIGVKLGYDLGLTKLYDESEENPKNRNAYMTVGYRF